MERQIKETDTHARPSRTHTVTPGTDELSLPGLYAAGQEVSTPILQMKWTQQSVMPIHLSLELFGVSCFEKGLWAPI